MYYIYLIRSEVDETQKYTGITQNLKRRLQEHTTGLSKHTAQYKPWKLVASFSFHDKHKAYEFEKYLKSHSGRTFANKRFW